MKTVLRLVRMFGGRDGARGDYISAGLTAAGVAAATALALTALAFLPALDARADRMAWREPSTAAAAAAADAGEAIAAQVRSNDMFGTRSIDRVDLAPLEDGAAGHADLPAPPGLDRFPAPGEVFLSPALRRLVAATPADQLGARFPGQVAGTIGHEGLAHEDELVAVVGRDAGELVPLAADDEDDVRILGQPSVVTAIDGFATSGSDENLTGYSQIIAVVGVLLTVPAVLLVGSAARLTAARRNQRLAALRLAGATPAVVVGLTAAETAVAAFAGAVAGLVLYAALLPAAALFPLAGGPFSASDLWIGAVPALLTLLVVPLLATISAVVALRKVSVTPLGVAQRVPGRRPRAVRLLGMAVAWVVLIFAAASFRDGGSLAVLLVGVGVVFGSLALIGPWIAWLLGKVLSLAARRASTLLAARRILDDPKAAYRAVSGIVLAAFVAGLVFAVAPSVDAFDTADAPESQLDMFVGGTPPADLRPTVEQELASRGIDARVAVDAEPDDLGWSLQIRPDDVADTEAIRTVVADIVPFQPLVRMDDDVDGDGTAFDDFHRTTVVMLLAALLMAGTATAIGSAAGVLDQRDTLSRLRLSGTPVSVLQRARVWHAALPLVVATVASLLSGMATAYLLMMAGGADSEEIRPPDFVSTGSVLAFGLVIGLASAAITRPLLVRSTAEAAA